MFYLGNFGIFYFGNYSARIHLHIEQAKLIYAEQYMVEFYGVSRVMSPLCSSVI